MARVMAWMLLLALLLFPAIARAQYGTNVLATQPLPGLAVQVLGGTFFSGGVVVGVNTQQFTLPQFSTNYIQFNGTSLLVNQSGFLQGNLPVAVVVTGQGAIQSISDARPQFVFSSSTGSGFASLTPGTNTNSGLYAISIPGIFTSTQYNNNFIVSLTDGGSCTNNASFKNTEVIQACASTPTSGTTNALTIGFASWIYANDPTQVGTNPTSPDTTVAGAKFVANCQVSHTWCYGSNPQANDVAGKTDTHIWGEEVDADPANTTTVGAGIVVDNIGTAQPAGDQLPAVLTFVQGSGAWTSGFECQQGSVVQISAGNAPCIHLSPLGAVNPTQSQSVRYDSKDSGGTVHSLDIQSVWNTAAGTTLMTSGEAYSQVAATFFSRQTAQTAANITASTGWGGSGAAGNSISAVSGYAQRFRFTITTGTTGANPTITATFSDPMPFAPLCTATQVGGSGTFGNIYSGTESSSSTGTMTFQGTPAGSSATYIIQVDCRL